MNTIGGTFKSIMNAVKPIFGVFRTLGRVIFFPLTIIMGVFDSIKGAIEGFKQEGILGGILGAIGGLARGLIGMPLDLLKSGISWIAGKLGFENFSEMLDSFSFSDMIFGMFMKVANIGNEIISNLFGGFEDGFGAGMKQMLKTLMIYIKRMLLFPVAILAGGVAALAAALPGGKGPLEAFSETFSKVIKVGEGSAATTLPSDQASGGGEEEPQTKSGQGDTLKPVERTEQGDIEKKPMNRYDRIQARVAREREATQKSQQGGGGGGVIAVNAPTSSTTNNSTAMYGEPTPATDDLDRVYGGGAFSFG